MTPSYRLILPVGTHIVSLIEQRNSQGQVCCLRGAVGEIVAAPTDDSHIYDMLSGIHLMQTGRIEANLTTLNATAQRPYLTELIARKQAEAEQSTCSDINLSFYEQEYLRLVDQLEQERDRSSLPEESSAQAALHDLLVRSRLSEIQSQP